MFNQTQPTATEQLANAKEALLQALVRKADAEAALKQADEQVQAIRNLLAGAEIGAKAEQEKAQVGKKSAE